MPAAFLVSGDHQASADLNLCCILPPPLLMVAPQWVRSMKDGCGCGVEEKAKVGCKETHFRTNACID